MNWMLLLAAEAAADEAGGLFDLNATLPLMAIQFLLLTAVLNVIFYKPLGNAIDERDEYVRTNVAGAKERLAEAEKLATQYEQELADSRRQAQAIIAEAQDEARAIASKEVAEAQRQAQAQKEEVQAELDQQKAEALAVLEQRVDELAREMISKLLAVA